MSYVTKGPTGENALTDLFGYFTRKKGPSGYGSGSTAHQVVANWDGTNKVAIVTGSNTGLGKECVAALASKGADVIIAVRDVGKGQAAADSIRGRHPGAKVSVMSLDLSSLASVRQFAADWKATGKPLHLLICNAGVMACPYMQSADGHELQFATNHLGHFLLVDLLKPALVSSAAAAGAPGRVVVLSSAAHFNPYNKKQGGPVRLDAIDSPEGYTPWGAYGQSKLCNVLFTRELHKRVTAEGLPIIAACCHPGGINTELGRHIKMNYMVGRLLFTMIGWMLKSIPQGAATETYLATAEGVLGGEYYADCNLSPSTAASHDAELGRKLWELSERLVKA
jgi:NAD(P)-dependent dehydrogenase (short-subunit alcohol dehydrogenase family)